MGRQIEQADFDELYDTFAKQAVKDFNERGSVQPQTFMLTLGKEPGQVTGFGALVPAIQKLFYSDNAGKDMLAQFIRMALTHGSPIRSALHELGLPLADVIIQISEAWMKKALKMEEHDVDKKKYGPSLEDHPGRQEVIIIGVHALHKTHMGFCPILENPRRAEFSPVWTEGRMTGRFSMGEGEEE
jgi:hypothetical protein